MEFVIFLALILDVSTYHRLVAMLADHTREIAVRPELPTSQNPLHVQIPPEDFARRQTLQQRDDLPHSIGR